jgi:hypothetical protein
MKKLVAAAVVAVLTFLAAPARAEEKGFTLGLRTAYALPLGTAGDGADLNELTSGAVPVQIELGYRLTRNVLAGAYFAWGYAMVADEAKSALAADGATGIGGHAVQRVGVQAIYSFMPGAKLAPWAGLGVGYEWARYASAELRSATGTADTEVGLRGFEALLQVGGDLRVAPKFTIGPFATLNVGRFESHVASVDETSGTFPGGDSSQEVSDKGFHEWIQLGVKGTFDF